jgi:predicted transcriptional regulator
MANKNIIIITIDEDLNNKIIKLCNKNNIDKDSFIAEALENQFLISSSQSLRLKEKIDRLCEENNMSKNFFITKALEEYCNKLKENK